MTDRAKSSAIPEDVRRHPDTAISRRRFIQGAVAVSAAAGAAALPAKARGATPPTPRRDAADAAGAGEHAGTYRLLTPEQGRVLAVVLNRIVPATDVMPGAGDVGVARFIDGVLVDAPHLRPRIIPLLQEANAGERFASLREAEQDARLREMARREKASFDTLLRAAYTGYYSEPRVLAAIGWDHQSHPPRPTPSFDVSRLDAVRKRGPIYRSVSTPQGGAS